MSDLSQPTSAFEGEALNAPVWSLIRVAEVAAETYARAQNPGEYGEGGTMDALAEWFPHLRDALEDAGLLK
jgi:hypothetical protein